MIQDAAHYQIPLDFLITAHDSIILHVISLVPPPSYTSSSFLITSMYCTASYSVLGLCVSEFKLNIYCTIRSYVLRTTRCNVL